MTPLRTVSVIVATRNRPALLRDALRSIRAVEAISDDLKFEILVGDNGTDADAAAVAEEFAARYFHTPKDGCPAARNLCLANATGEFIAFLDDDDVWFPENIRPQIKMLDEQPSLSAVFGQIVYADQKLNIVGEAWPSESPVEDDVFVKMLSGYFPQVGASVIRGSVASEIGLMDETLIGDSDWDWQLQIARDRAIGFVAVPGVCCRVRSAGSFDDLTMRRAGFTRRIFWRHALPNLRRWRTPIAFVRSYYGSQEGYFNYFLEAAMMRASCGEHKGARRAVVRLLGLNPSRGLKMLAGFRPLREAALYAFGVGGKPEPAPETPMSEAPQ
ncbi:glycosyltransferase [Hyphomonas sp. WL0036]|uniref:glycosyltransferase family 2 protein n=1 Tax=Hyphomonas sediminis TaxID=2866160 RepID=UPI001C8089CF|nr:glycosyltransferase family 2 protein [Hyphomonas sediminis]MBY9067943.1 glycosyltransferase [Hyphomonas sediminis]